MAAYPATALLLLGLATAASAQTPEQTKPSPMTLSGCVSSGQSPQAPVTFADADSEARYRLSGRSLKKYSGQRVEIIGTMGKPVKVAIRGGLYPSPNVAGQAGALDPVKAAIAAQPGGPESGTGSADLLPEIKVTRVRVLEGSCK